MKRLDFLGLNSNQAACVLLYLIAVLWVLHLSSKRAWIKIVLIITEVVLIVALAATMSRGGVVVLVCVVVYLRSSKVGRSLRLSRNIGTAHRDGSPYQRIANWLSHSPIWRVLLLLTSPGLWMRSSPGYVAQDASIGNRLELWKGGAKLIADAPLHGWGYYNTGASFMNWFQNVEVHTHYNGLVNSFLQIGAAFGLPVLFGVLFVLILSLLSAHHKVARAFLPVQILNRVNIGTGRNACATLEDVNSGTGRNACATFLCFLWLAIWMLMSCFSSMLSSPMLFVPPLVAILTTLLLHPPRRPEVAGALMISFSICLLIFTTGHALERNDSLTIKRDMDGIITITNSEIKTGRRCLIYIDEGALGGEYGKELRKFLPGSDIETCVVVRKVAQTFLSVPGSSNKPGTDRNVCATFNTGRVDLIILSGITADQVEIKEGPAKYILLNPAFLPDNMPVEPVQAILYPEINRQHLEPKASILKKFQSKIRMVPFNQNFETSWSEYLNL